MKAAIFREVNKPLTIEEVQIDQPQAREVLVRTVACGVCHSDLHFMEGIYPWPTPAILGHEVAGIVEAVGASVTGLKPGDHVIACLSVFCGHCDYCLSGRPALCPSPEMTRAPTDKPRLSKDGGPISQFLNISGFAEKILVHENALVKIRDDMPLDRAALIGCGVVTGLGAVLNTANVEAGATVAVIGAGGVGLSVIQGAVLASAGMIIAVDIRESKLEMARRLGATHTIDASKQDPVATIMELTGGGVHYSFEVIGNKSAAEQAFAMLRRGGTATVVGMVPLGETVDLPALGFLNEKKIQGSLLGSNRFPIDMPRYVEFYKRGLLKLDEMITRRYRLEEINEAYRALKAGEVMRSVIMFD